MIEMILGGVAAIGLGVCLGFVVAGFIGVFVALGIWLLLEYDQ